LQRDPRWKRIALRWPKSADGKWYWKCDTSSDELDGHFFLYACYYDLVAETEAERQPVREVVTAIIDHLLTHDFNLVDHDGKPTRWARFGPSTLNDPGWIEERGLNSLSILSYLAVAEHVTGEKRFRDALVHLVKDYALSVEPRGGQGALRAGYRQSVGRRNGLYVLFQPIEVRDRSRRASRGQHLVAALLGNRRTRRQPVVQFHFRGQLRGLRTI
jgi:hypothetical protein